MVATIHSLRLLGPVEIHAHGREIVADHRPRLIFVLLAECMGQVLSDDELISAVWGDDAPDSADSALRTYVASARRIATPLGLTLERHGGRVPQDRERGYVLKGDLAFFDLREFRRLRTVCVTDAPATRLAELREAHALWRGHALADLRQFPGGESLGVLLDRERDVIRDRLLEALVDTGAVDEAIVELTTRAGLDPFDTRMQALLVRAHYYAGRHVEALSLLRATMTHWREIGLDPPEQLNSLEIALLNQNLQVPERTVTGTQLPAELAGLARERFFGRREPVTRLTSVLVESTRTGRSRVVRLSGEPGSGKSHLLAEVARRAAGDGWQCMYAWCDDATSLAFAALRRALRIEDDVGASAGPTSSAQQHWARHARLRQAMRNGSASAPMLVLLDDCQWMDEPSRLFLRQLDRTPLASPVVVVLAERAPLLDGWTSGRLTEISLRPYSADELSEIAVAHQRDDAWAAAVLEATNGLPLLVHDAVGRADADLSSVAIAARSGRVLLDERWRTMAEPARDVIRQAAVLGAQFTLDQLVDCVDVDPDLVFDAVDEAYRHGILEFDATVARRCQFTHSTMRAGALDSLSPVQRGRFHNRVLTRLVGSLDELAAWGHATAAWPAIPAATLVDHAVAAAERLHTDLSLTDGLAVVDRAHEQLGDARNRLEPTRAARLSLAEAKARAAVGQLARARTLFEQSSQHARLAGDYVLGTQADRSNAALGYVVVEDRAMSERLQRRLVEMSPDARLAERFMLLHQIADDALLAGRYVEADDALGQLAELDARESDPYRESLLCGVLHLRAHLRGTSDERRRVAARVRALGGATSTDHLASRIARIDLIEALHDGRTVAAGRDADRLVEASRSIGEARGEWLGMAARVNDPFLHGRFDDASRVAADAEAFGREHVVDAAAEAHFGQEFTLQWMRGELGAWADPEPPRAIEGTFAWSAGLALIYATAGRRDVAADILLARLGDIEREGSQWLGLVGVVFAVEAATLSGTSEIGAPARHVLSPHLDDHVMIGSGVLDLGPAARYLALAESLDGDTASAAERLEQVAADDRSGGLWASRARDDLAALTAGARS